MNVFAILQKKQQCCRKIKWSDTFRAQRKTDIEIMRSGCKNRFFNLFLHLDIWFVDKTKSFIHCRCNNLQYYRLEIAIYGVCVCACVYGDAIMRCGHCRFAVTTVSISLPLSHSVFSYHIQSYDYAWLVNAQIISCNLSCTENGKWKEKMFTALTWNCTVLSYAQVRINHRSQSIFVQKPDHTFIAFLRLNRIHGVYYSIYAQKTLADLICWRSIRSILERRPDFFSLLRLFLKLKTINW